MTEIIKHKFVCDEDTKQFENLRNKKIIELEEKLRFWKSTAVFNWYADKNNCDIELTPEGEEFNRQCEEAYDIMIKNGLIKPDMLTG